MMNSRKLKKYSTQLMSDLFHFLDQGISPFHVCKNLSDQLRQAGYVHILESELSTDALAQNKKAFIQWNDAMVAAYRRGSQGLKGGLRIWVAHLDSPALAIKPCPLRLREGFWQAETLVYGGPILNTYFDRPLGVAGRAFIQGPTGIQCELVDFPKGSFYLPSLAIHFNRDVNTGHRIETQKELRLVYSAKRENEKEQELPLERLIAEHLGCDEKAVLDYDLFTYEAGGAFYFGRDQEFFSSSRIDDLGMVHAGLKGLLDSDNEADGAQAFEGLSLLLIFSNEEIGSLTRQGARSGILGALLESLREAEGLNHAEYLAALSQSYALSADQAHAVHPNFMEYAAEGTRPKLNGGPVLKYALQSYGTDAKGAAFFKALCQNADIPYQLFTNRSDLRGGSAIGPLLFPQLPIAVADIGNPQWAMHSLRECAGSDDQALMALAAKAFFSLSHPHKLKTRTAKH